MACQQWDDSAGIDRPDGKCRGALANAELTRWLCRAVDLAACCLRLYYV